uniref:Uncharacterized protein n=1 Tax=Ditylenchus dipsaci TaxID=166011 RepID=A0A915CRC0_9BILA
MALISASSSQSFPVPSPESNASFQLPFPESRFSPEFLMLRRSNRPPPQVTSLSQASQDTSSCNGLSVSSSASAQPIKRSTVLQSCYNNVSSDEEDKSAQTPSSRRSNSLSASNIPPVTNKVSPKSY